MKILNTLIALCSLVLMSGCSLTNDVYFTSFSNEGASVYDPIDPSSVRIYSSKLPEKPYEELGIMTLKSLYIPDDRTFVYERFRRTAAAMGANGILLLPDRSISDGVPVVTRRGAYYDNYNDTYLFSATAIRVKE